ncbi:MAG: 50S ribosomal protein L30 [Alphaproteobacteria bacterium]|nr:50S ribosomal protein L30 [Alphaproteobacteria bacterium]
MKKLKVTLRKSTIGSTQSQIATVKGLGLRKIRSTRTLDNTPAVRGMVKKIIHLVDVEEVEVADA